MILKRRRSATPPTVDARIFSDAAAATGFSLDAAQRHAAGALATDASIYLVGPAGRGKTWLLDTLVTALPAGEARRLHWHEFVRRLHLLIREHGGLDNAVAALLDGISILCFDELHVTDRADGIFVHRLLTSAWDRGIRVVITTNAAPQQQMPNPLMHRSFTPTIDLIERNCRVVELDAGIDYRRHTSHDTGFAAGRWCILDDVPTTGITTSPVSMNGRHLNAWDASDDHLGATFAELCGKPLGTNDYLALVRRFPTWTVSDVPDFASTGADAAIRFVHLIDVLYDSDIPVTITSRISRSQLAAGSRQPLTAARLHSRLSTLVDA